MLSRIKEHHDSALCMDASLYHHIKRSLWFLVMKSAEFYLPGGWIHEDSINAYMTNGTCRLYVRDSVLVMESVYDELLHV